MSEQVNFSISINGLKLRSMKIYVLLIFQCFLVILLHAQADSSKNGLGEKTAKNDSTFVKVEIESDFPGGQPAWIRFLNQNLVYPPKAVRRNVEGTVWLQFIVEKNGSLNDIQVISGPGLLVDAALKVIRESPNWKPAIQDGRKVRSYKKQPITFRLK